MLKPDQANELIRAGKIDAAVFGQLWIGNPDLQARIEKNIDLNNDLNYKGFYNFPEGKNWGGVEHIFLTFRM